MWQVETIVRNTADEQGEAANERDGLKEAVQVSCCQTRQALLEAWKLVRPDGS